MTRFWTWFARLVGIGIAVFAVRVLLVERTASLQTPMPHPPKVDAPSAPQMDDSASNKTNQDNSGESGSLGILGVKYRLIDRLDQAEIIVPPLDEPRLRSLLRAHWRKLHSPFVGPSGSVGRLVQQIGLAKRAARKANAAGPKDGHWHADPKLWGMDEGTYDQREAVLAPAPSRLAWKIDLPVRSVLETAPAAFGADGEVEFEVAVTQAGVRHVLGTRRLSNMRRWNDWRIDLSGYNGDVLLELKTSSQREVPLSAWGSPIILSPNASPLPYNTVFIVVDAMRGDAMASTHDAAEDVKLAAATLPPLDAWLPRMPEVAPNLDKLAARGAVFASAFTTAMWTRPATLSMLSGMRPRHLSLPVLELEPRPEQIREFYAARPPLYALLMRDRGAVTRAIVNNMYLCGYVGVGVDTGFEALTDHRYQIGDTHQITTDTVEWLQAHRDERFALFINYTSPHSPYLPERKFLKPITKARVRPDNGEVLRYLGEIRKDDEGIGHVLEALDNLGLAEKTAIVVTADHGETMSEAHNWVAIDVAKGVRSGRFTHLSTMWDEAARVPIVMALPGRIKPRQRITSDVQLTDIMPTLLELEGIRIPNEIEGASLLPLLEGKSMAPRPVVVEGRGAQAIRDGLWRLVVRSPIARRLRKGNIEFEKYVELYDLSNDPGERHDVATANKDVVKRFEQELLEILGPGKAMNTQKADTNSGTIHVRFATAGRSAHIRGIVRLRGEGSLKIVSDAASVRSKATDNNGFEIDVESEPERASGFRLLVVPADAEIQWQWWLDGSPWPRSAIFGGPLNVSIPELAQGLGAASSDKLIVAEQPYIAAKRELGLYVTRDLSLEVNTTPSESAQLEAQQAMQAWGYMRVPDAAAQRKPGTAGH